MNSPILRLLSLLVFFLFTLTVYAQNAAEYDKERLLDYYQSQRYAEAADYLISLHPGEISDVKLLNQIAYCFMMAGKLPDAEKYYVLVNAKQPSFLPALFNLANINLKRGNSLKARGYLENVVRLDSTNFNAFKQLAALYPQDTVAERVSMLYKASRLNPAEPDVAYDLATALRKLRQYEPAYQILSTAIAADTGNLVLQQARLPIAIQLKKYSEVIQTGEKLLSTGIDPPVVRDVAMAYYYLRNYTKAISYFQQLETINSQTESTLYYTALSYRHLKNYKLAAQYTKGAIAEGISTNISSYYVLLGGIYEIDQQLQSAINAHKKGLTFNANSMSYYSLGILYDLKLNQKKTALTYYRQYLNSKPDPATDKDQIAYVRSRLLELQPVKK